MALSVEDGARLIALEAELRRRESGGGGPRQGQGFDWTFQQREDRINAEEAKYPNIPRGLSKAVAYHESKYNLTAEGDGGQAKSLFQLHPGAAKDAGIDPAQRHIPELNVQGGVKYLSQKIDQAGGNIDKALSLYNRGTPDYRGIGDPNYLQNVYKYWQERPGELAPQRQASQRQPPGMLARLGQALSPASAEAATPAAAGTSRLEALEAELARREGQGQPAPAPAAPAVSPAPPSARLSMGDPADAASEAEAAATIAQMRARHGPPPSSPTGALALGGGPMQQARAVTDPAARLAGGTAAPQAPAASTAQDQQTRIREELAAWEQQVGRPWREGDPRLPSEKRVGVPDEAPLEEGITKPSTMIPLLMPGAGARAGMRILPEAWRWVGRMGGEALTQTAGELSGKAIETGQAPNWHEVATTTAWNLAPQAGEELLRAVPRAILRSGQGARTLLSDVAAQESKGLGRRVFHSQDEQVLARMFEDVKASGVKLDIDPVTDLLASLTPTQRHVLLRDVGAISSPLAAALARGGTSGAPRLTGWDIGDLQTLRSELITRGHAVRTPERQDLINEMRMAVDDAISHGMAVGSTAAGGNPEMLKAAQAGWRRLKQSDDLQALVTKHTNYTPNLQYQDLNLAALRKSLDGTNPLGRKVARSLGQTETVALQHELATLATRYPFVKVPNSILNIGGKVGLPGAGYLAITGNMPGAAVAASSAVMALALQSPRAMSLFREAIVNGKGRVSTNDLAAIVNAARQVSDVEDPASGSRQ